EIRQDRLVETGEMVYQPHTSKAIEYAALMAEPTAGDSAETINVNSETEIEFPGLSPEFAADLKAPYSRNNLVKDYDIELEKIATQERGEELYTRRLALNRSY